MKKLSKKTKILASSLVAILVSAGIASGATYSLFTSEAQNNIAITAGKVQATAKLGEITIYSADATLTDGEEVPGGEDLGTFAHKYYYNDRTQAGSWLAGGKATLNTAGTTLTLDRMVPGDRVDTTFKVTNNSNVDVKYRLVAECLDEDETSLRFFSNLEIEALGRTMTHVRKFATPWTLWDNGQTEISSTVRIIFPITCSNVSQDRHCNIKFSVEMVQSNAYTRDDIQDLFVQFVDKKVEAAPIAHPTSSGLKDLDLEAWKDETLIELGEDATVKVHVPAGSGDVKALVEIAPGVQEKQDLQLDDTLTLKVEAKDYEGTYIIKENDEVLNYEISLYNQNNQKIITVEEGEPLDVYINIGSLSSIKEVLHSGTKLLPNDGDDLEVGEYEYDESTGIVHILTNTFSPFSVIYETTFAGGNGTAENPLLIANANQWVALCTIYEVTEGKYCIYYPADEDGLHVKLIADIDLKDVDLPYCYGIYYLFLDGDNHKLLNVNDVSIFGEEAPDWYGYSEVKDLTIENSSASYALFGYGTQNSPSASILFDNVDLKNCSANGGAYQYYSGSGNVKFVDCDAIDVNVTGGYMCSGGFVGNISTGKLEIDHCSFGGSVVSTQSACGGFVGQAPNLDFFPENVIIKNSTILAGTVIRNIAGGYVSAFDAFNASVNYAQFGNTFNGVLEGTSNMYKQGCDAAETKIYVPCCVSTDFEFNKETGVLTYNGQANLGKIVVQEYVNDDEIYYGDYYGGYNYYVCDPMMYENISTGSTMGNIPVLIDLYNVVSSVETPVGLQTLDDTYVDEIHDGIFYLDARTYSWGHYLLSGTYNSTTGQPIEPQSLKARIQITIYDENGVLNSSVGISYTIDLTNHGHIA